ncbi:MAG TPA: peptidoglycan bridge formation glycyltransferase FemA/FemB family protein [Bacilli bacterium]|nr:peptidoglycan bridge formation glycyltransferase FemA/FemB family protein [Bacilli bacterium]
MKIVELDKKQFDDFAIQDKYRSFYQTSQYGTLMSKHGFKPIYVGLDDGGELKVAALILIKNLIFGLKFGYSPRGYLIDFNDYNLVYSFTTLLKEYLEKYKLLYITIDPHVTHLIRDKDGKPINSSQSGVNISESLKRIGYEHRGFNLYFETFKPRWNMVLKTDKPSNLVFNDFEKTTRTKIRNAMRKGVEIYKGNKDDLKLFYKMIEKKHYRKYNYYLDMYEIFGKFDMFDIYFAKINTEVFLKNSRLLYQNEVKKNEKLANDLQNCSNTKEKNKLLNRKIESDKLMSSYKQDIVYGTNLYKTNKYIIVASNAIIKYGNEIFFLIDGINFKFKNFNANDLLKWKIIEEYRNKGYKKFHLNGITGDFTKKNKYLGLYIFKRVFNTTVTEYIGEYSLIINKGRYFLYKQIRPLAQLFNPLINRD